MHQATESSFNLMPWNLLFDQQQKTPSSPFSTLPQRLFVSRTIEPSEDRVIQFDFLRDTEMAALNANGLDRQGKQSSSRRCRIQLHSRYVDQINVRGEIFIGERIKDGTSRLFAGKRIGFWEAGAHRRLVITNPCSGRDARCGRVLRSSDYV